MTTTLISQGSFTIDPTGSKITIGDGHSSVNKLVLAIKNNGKQAIVKVTVKVKCGATPEALLDANTVKVTASYSNGSTPVNLSPVPPTSDSRSWVTRSECVTVASDQQLSILLSDFDSNTPVGDAIVNVLVELGEVEGEDTFFEPTVGDKDGSGTDLNVIKGMEGKLTDSKIHYFTVAPDFILQAGQDPVTVGFYATGFESLVLFRNNREVLNWPSNETPKNPDGSITGTFLDKPSITTVYRLEGKPTTDHNTIEKIRYRTVQVISPGWNQIALPQGYPARLFVNKDFTPADGKPPSDRLYGIFIDDAGVAALYSSATGVDDWRLEPGDVPQDMARSPGVACDNKLWLIGGSCVEPDKPRSDVWSYEESPPGSNSMAWIKQDVKGDDEEGDFPERMGHACVVVDQKVWVIGGYKSPETFKDIWRLNVKGVLKWEKVDTKGSPKFWPRRLNPAAASFINEDRSNEVWIYGGTEKPQSGGLHDLWSTGEGTTWQEREIHKIVPDPGTPLGAALVAYPQTDSSGNVTSNRLFLIGSFREWARSAPAPQGNRVSSFLFEWHELKQVWEAQPLFNGWQQFGGGNFYMQAIFFNRFLFVWSLQRIHDSKLKLNVLVS